MCCCTRETINLHSDGLVSWGPCIEVLDCTDHKGVLCRCEWRPQLSPTVCPSSCRQVVVSSPSSRYQSVVLPFPLSGKVFLNLLYFILIFKVCRRKEQVFWHRRGTGCLHHALVCLYFPQSP